MSALLNFLFGQNPKTISTLAPWQQNQAQKLQRGVESSPLFGSGNDFLMKLLSGDSSAFENFERPYQERFEQETIPDLLQKFAGLGTGGGALSSSGLQNSLAQAGRGLAGDLAQMRSGLQLNALPQALQYAQQPYNNYIQSLGINTMAQRSGSAGFLPQFLGAFAGKAFGG